jgi:hypothetical protein
MERFLTKEGTEITEGASDCKSRSGRAFYYLK